MQTDKVGNQVDALGHTAAVARAGRYREMSDDTDIPTPTPTSRYCAMFSVRNYCCNSQYNCLHRSPALETHCLLQTFCHDFIWSFEFESVEDADSMTMRRRRRKEIVIDTGRGHPSSDDYGTRVS